MVTGRQIREACELLRWNRYDLQRRTALPLHVVDQVMTSEQAIEASIAPEIVLRDALQRAGIEFFPDPGGAGVRLRKKDP